MGLFFPFREKIKTPISPHAKRKLNTKEEKNPKVKEIEAIS